ncbi:hypothetical protein LP417_33595 (plasmid) [Polaromonas sp. P1-6]|nr:hypothetical protein LP417_33595 [Polaromonas sp. P1-6]
MQIGADGKKKLLQKLVEVFDLKRTDLHKKYDSLTKGAHAHPLSRTSRNQTSKPKTSAVRKIYGRSTDLRPCKCSWAAQEKFHNPLGLKAFRLWRHQR